LRSLTQLSKVAWADFVLTRTVELSYFGPIFYGGSRGSMDPQLGAKIVLVGAKIAIIGAKLAIVDFMDPHCLIRASIISVIVQCYGNKINDG